MTITNGYCTFNEYKARYFSDAKANTARDAFVEQMIEAASRWIDQYTGRVFYAETDTRTMTAVNGYTVNVRDLISVTTLKADDDGDRTYETAWASTDFDLWPDDAPYQWIEVTPNSTRTFPTGRRGVQIVGSWGWPQTSTTSSATLAEALDASETGVDVSDGTAFSVGMTIVIDSEVMFVDAIATNTLTVRRGQNGSTAATHDSGAAITVLSAPAAIREACMLLTGRLFKRKDAVLGVAGSTSLGVITTATPEDKDIERLLQSFVKVTI